MPDTTIPFETMSNQSTDQDDEPFLNGAQMRELLEAYVKAGDAYKPENGYDQKRDEPRVLAAFTEAQENVLYARTIDPEGVAIKLRVLNERGDMPEDLQDVFGDLALPRPAPSLVDLAKTLAEAVRPHIENGGDITSRAEFVSALAPLIGHYTIADAVCMIGFLRTAGAVLGDENGSDDALFAVNTILEDFASLADAADADSVAARAHLIEKAAEDDAWGLGDANLRAATRRAASDVRHVCTGKLPGPIFGATFVSKIQYPDWLMRSIEHNEGGEASSEYAERIHAARRAGEAEQLMAAE